MTTTIDLLNRLMQCDNALKPFIESREKRWSIEADIRSLSECKYHTQEEKEKEIAALQNRIKNTLDKQLDKHIHKTLGSRKNWYYLFKEGLNMYRMADESNERSMQRTEGYIAQVELVAEIARELLNELKLNQ